MVKRTPGIDLLGQKPKEFKEIRGAPLMLACSALLHGGVEARLGLGPIRGVSSSSLALIREREPTCRAVLREGTQHEQFVSYLEQVVWSGTRPVS